LEKKLSTLCRGKLKMLQSPVMLDLRSGKTRGEKYRYYRNLTIFEKLYFQNVSCPHKNAKPTLQDSSGFRGILENFRFRDR